MTARIMNVKSGGAHRDVRGLNMSEVPASLADLSSAFDLRFGRARRWALTLLAVLPQGAMAEDTA